MACRQARKKKCSSARAEFLPVLMIPNYERAGIGEFYGHPESRTGRQTWRKGQTIQAADFTQDSGSGT